MTRTTSIFIALAVTVATPQLTAAATIVQTADQTGDGYADSWTLDDNGDGIADRLIIDGNQDGTIEISASFTSDARAIVVWVDTNLDGYWDLVLEPQYANQGTGARVAQILWRDFDQDGRWENRYYDGQLDGIYEWVMVDTNFDGVADNWRGNAAPQGRSAVDEIARDVASVGAVNILHSAGLQVYFPSLVIP